MDHLYTQSPPPHHKKEDVLEALVGEDQVELPGWQVVFVPSLALEEMSQLDLLYQEYKDWGWQSFWRGLSQNFGDHYVWNDSKPHKSDKGQDYHNNNEDDREVYEATRISFLDAKSVSFLSSLV